jgi:hypothetical protein
MILLQRIMSDAASHPPDLTWVAKHRVVCTQIRALGLVPAILFVLILRAHTVHNSPCHSDNPSRIISKPGLARQQ